MEKKRKEKNKKRVLTFLIKCYKIKPVAVTQDCKLKSSNQSRTDVDRNSEKHILIYKNKKVKKSA